jgi:hypothetical protein
VLLAGGGALAANTVLGIIPKSLAGPKGGAVITCKEGRRFLESKGYSVNLSLDCRPRFFIYAASRQGNSYVVTVDGRYPRIVSASKD